MLSIRRPRRPMIRSMIISPKYKILDTKLDTTEKEPSKYWTLVVPAVGLEPDAGPLTIIPALKPFVHKYTILLGFPLSTIIDDIQHNSQEYIRIDNYWTRTLDTFGHKK